METLCQGPHPPLSGGGLLARDAQSERTLQSAGSHDAFTFTSCHELLTGELIWVAHTGGVADDNGSHIAILDGQVIQAAPLDGDRTLGRNGDDPDPELFDGDGGSDVVVMGWSLDDGAGPLWHAVLGGSGDMTVNRVAVQPGRNTAVIGGHWTGEARFGRGQVGDVMGGAPATSHGYVIGMHVDP